MFEWGLRIETTDLGHGVYRGQERVSRPSTRGGERAREVRTGTARRQLRVEPLHRPDDRADEKDLLRLTAFEQGPQVLDRKYGALDVGAEVGAQVVHRPGSCVC